MKKCINVLSILMMLEGLFFIFIKNGQLSLSLALVLTLIITLFIIDKLKNNDKLEFLLLISIIASICLMPYLTKTNVFLFISDQIVEYDQYGTEWKRLLTNFITNGSFPFYSFNSFLGNNFYAAKSFNVTGDIFYFIVMLFETVNEGYLFEMYLMTVAGGLFAYMYLDEFGIENKKVIVIVALLFSFGGVSVSNLFQYFWRIYLTYFALLMYGIELYRKRNKLFIFTISVCLCFLANSYFMFPTTLFLVPYFFFTYYFHNDNINLVSILKKSIKPFVAYIVGFLLSGILIIPTIIYMANNNRVGSGVDTNLLYDFKVYVNYIYSMLIITFANKYTNYFTTSGSASYHYWGFTIYNGMLLAPVIFSSFFFKNRERKEKIMNIFVIFITIITLVPLTSSIMHGFSGASMKWSFLTAFVYLINFAVFFDSKKINIDAFKKGLLLYIVIFLVVTILAIVFNILPIKLDDVQLFNALICICLLMIYYFILKNHHTFLALVFCCIEVICVFILYLAVANTEFTFQNDSLDRNSLAYIKDISNDKFYRISVDGEKLAPFIKDLNLNQSLNYDYKSVTGYDSTYEPNLQVFLEMNGIDWHIMKLTNPEVLKMLGVKYYYVKDENELPEGYDFTYVTDSYNWKVYLFNDYRPLGFTYSLFTNNKFEIKDDNKWNSVLFVDNALLDDTSGIQKSDSVNFNVSEYYDDNNIKGHISIQNKQVLFLSIPYNDGWKIKDNGNTVKTYKVQGGFIGIVLEPGDHYIELNFTPPGLKIGCISSLVGAFGLAVLFVIDKKFGYK